MYSILLLTVLAVVWVVRHRLSDPFRDIPGPWLARYTSLWIAYQARRRRKWIVVNALHKKHGPFVRLSPTHISIADPRALPHVYGRGATALPKSPFYHTFVDADTPSVFSATDPALHAQKTKLISPALSTKALSEFVPMIEGTVAMWVEKLDSVAGEGVKFGEEFSVLGWFHLLGFDIISDLAFGEKLGMIANGSDRITLSDSCSPEAETSAPSAMQIIDDRENMLNMLGILPWLAPFAPLLARVDPLFANGLSGASAVVDFARACVGRRLAAPGLAREDILQKLINAYTAEGRFGSGKDAQGMDSDAAVETLVRDTITLLIAGADSVSCTMGAVIFYVLSTPRVCARLMDELRGACPGGDADATWERVKGLEYLQACIDEAMRLYTVLSLGLPRSVPKGSGGVEILGHIFPEGTELSVPQLSVHRNPAIWGDAEAFRPERFLEPGGGELKKYLMGFGMGSRACIGRNLAQIEMRVGLGRLLLRYEMVLCSRELDVVENGFMTKPTDVRVKLMRRPGACV